MLNLQPAPFGVSTPIAPIKTAYFSKGPAPTTRSSTMHWTRPPKGHSALLPGLAVDETSRPYTLGSAYTLARSSCKYAKVLAVSLPKSSSPPSELTQAQAHDTPPS